MKFKKGSKVQWKWLGRNIQGIVLQSFVKPIEKEIKGKKIKRNGSAENPAYLVQSESGNEALKLQTELSSPDAAIKKQAKPRMFS